MARSWLILGAFGAALAVAAGAFGAHGLRARLDADALALWETAARYLMYGALGLLALGATASRLGTPASAAGWCLAVGTFIFSSTVAVLALGGPRWLGAVTPLGGLLMIIGFVLFGVAALFAV
jgi:uncharacterized membrane protein YgdD (TMEM256/DUF423 family)